VAKKVSYYLIENKSLAYFLLFIDEKSIEIREELSRSEAHKRLKEGHTVLNKYFLNNLFLSFVKRN
jgi:hypothetical protein